MILRFNVKVLKMVHSENWNGKKCMTNYGRNNDPSFLDLDISLQKLYLYILHPRMNECGSSTTEVFIAVFLG